MRRKLDKNVTHLIAYRCAGEKVRNAALASGKIATMKVSWVEAAWSSRHSNPELNACDLDFVVSCFLLSITFFPLRIGIVLRCFKSVVCVLLGFLKKAKH